MAIRLKEMRYGPGYYQLPGTVIELTEPEERALVAAGKAVAIGPVETATKPTPEIATRGRQKHRPRRG